MFNPVGDNDYASLPTLVAAYQMIKPGEHARAHRHTPNALRLILSADDEVYTVVDGVQLPMKNGDVVLTPGWTWHSHFNNGNHNAYWIDFLDVPLVHRLEPMCFEPHPDEYQQVEQTPAESPMRFTIQAQQALLSPSAAADGVREATLDTPSLRTIQLNVYQMDAGASTVARRTAANHLFAITEGEGVFQVADQRFDYQRGDVIAVPMWAQHQVVASTPTHMLN